MPRYVDGFVIPVPKKNLAKYRKISAAAGKIWMEYGALEYMETVGDDMNPKMPVTFGKTLKLKAGETVVFSWIVYKTKAQRDQVNKKIMKDPRMLAMMNDEDHPFDYKRMLYAGFKPIVDLQK